MCSDNDIKIAGDKPSLDILKNSQKNSEETAISKKQAEAARLWGEAVALRFINDVKNSEVGEKDSDLEMLAQRRILLSFTASVGFEKLCSNDTLGGLAQKSFLDTLRKKDPKHYITPEDTGAFSFYYLAFRRGNDVERRIGQTFAMLCSHDGDPIYQELGEALYCWFLSVVKEYAEQFNIV
ncbi:MAG: hypothetical protein ACOYJS_01310 [Acutalibacteraceae bacterium]|jgi:hypothetical protein